MVPADSPVLIAVCGHPATGKTSFARALGARLGVPVFNKDTIKELLWDRLGDGDVDWSHRLGIASFGLLDTIAEVELKSGRTVIVEGNFHEEYGMSLRGVADRTAANVFVVVVGGDPEVVLERFRQRAATGERHPAHPDEQLLPEIEGRLLAGYDPPPLGGTRVDVDLTRIDDAAVSAALDEVAQAIEVAFPEST